MNADRNIRVGFIGAGGIAGNHFAQLEQIETADMVAFCDVDISRAQAAVEKYGGKAYSSAREMLGAQELDACYICLPPHVHGEPEMLCAERRIPVFVEKPISNSLSQAKEIADAIKRSGIVSSVGYHFRYMSGTQRTKEALDPSQIGMVMGYWMGGFPGVAWWRRMDQSGGQINEQTTHIVDLARYLVGEVSEVYAAYATRSQNIPENSTVPDVGTVTLRFENGVVGQISNTCLLNLGYTVGLTVVTPERIFEIGPGDLNIVTSGGREQITGDVNPYLEEDRAFIHAVRTKDTGGIRSSYDDAVKTLEVTLAANESALTGQPVSLGGR